MFLPQERSQQPLSTEGPHLSVPASVIVSAPPPAQDPAPATPVAKGAGLGPQAPDSQASPVPAPQVEEPQQPLSSAQPPASPPYPLTAVRLLAPGLPASVSLTWGKVLSSPTATPTPHCLCLLAPGRQGEGSTRWTGLQDTQQERGSSLRW